MILAGFVIAIGVVVDDAIIDVENIVRRLRQYRKEGSTQVDGEHHSRGVARSAPGHHPCHADRCRGACCRSSSWAGCRARSSSRWRSSYGLAVLASMFVALTVTPALCLILLANAPIERHEPPLVRWLQRIYDAGAGAHHPAAAPGVRRHRRSSCWSAWRCCRCWASRCFLQFKERDFLIHWITKPGTSVIEEQRIVTQISRELRAIPGVRNFGSHIGQALLADEINGVNFGENWISIDPAADYDETVAAIEKVVYGYPGLFHNVETYLNERIDEVLTGSSETFVVRIYGPDLKGIHSKADEVEQALQGDPRHRRSARAAPIRGAPGAGRGQPGGGAALWPQAGRCAPGGGDPAGRRRSRRPFQGWQGVRCECLEHARNAQQPEQHSRSADRHARRRACAPGRCRRRAHCAGAERHLS